MAQATAVLAVILVQHGYIDQKVVRGVVQVAWRMAVEAVITAVVMVVEVVMEVIKYFTTRFLSHSIYSDVIKIGILNIQRCKINGTNYITGDTSLSGRSSS
jgi:hypothetical protein